MFEWVLLLVVAAAATVMCMLGMLLLRTVLSQQQIKFDKTAKTDLAAMFIFIDPQVLFRYSLGAMVLIPLLFCK
jgi:hypothetical protein